MAKYEISDIAQSDMESIAQYLISKNAASAAERLIFKFFKGYDRLAIFPLSGATVKAKRLNHFRFVIVEKYYIFYTFKNNIVNIERVLHTARNYKAIL